MHKFYKTLLISSFTLLGLNQQVFANDLEYSSNIQQLEKNKYENKYKKVELIENNENTLISPYIYNGSDAYLSEFPFYVKLITYYQGDSYFVMRCGGSILDEYHILTAAHCVYNEDLNPYAAVFTDNNSFLFDDLSYFEKVYIHPDYKDTKYKNDIAVVKLSKPLVGNYTAINIPDKTEYDLYNSVDEYTVIGMGELENGKISTHLKKGVVERKNKSYCKLEIEAANKDEYNIDKYICANQLIGTDSCSGDSGGPLTYLSNGKYQQIGLVSYGVTYNEYNNKCGSPNSFTVYSDIYSHKDFIENAIKGKETAITPENDDGGSSSSSSAGSIGYIYILILGGLLLLRERLFKPEKK